MFKTVVLLLTVTLMLAVAAVAFAGPQVAPSDNATSVAGRVNEIDRAAKTFLVKPYLGRVRRSPMSAPDVRIKVSGATTYRYSPATAGGPAPTFDKVKRGSWVRVQHANGLASEVVIHNLVRDR